MFQPLIARFEPDNRGLLRGADECGFLGAGPARRALAFIPNPGETLMSRTILLAAASALICTSVASAHITLGGACRGEL